MLRQNPRLRSAQFGRDAADARLAEATLKPQWSVGLEVEDFLGTGSLTGFGSSESTLRLSRIFQSDDARSGRMAVASAVGRQIDNSLEADRLDLMTVLAQRFVEVVYRQEAYSLAEQSVQIWEAGITLALARERAGAAPAVDRLRTEIRVANAKLSMESAGRELQAARVSLAATWGDSTADFGRADASLCDVSGLPPFEVLAKHIERNPDLLRFATERRLREAEGQLAAARQKPDWTLSAGVRHVAAIDDQALLFSVSVPLGAKSRAAPAARRSTALREQSALVEQDYKLAVRATLFDLFQKTLHTVKEVELFENEILPKAKAIRNEIEGGYRVGRFSHTALVNAQAELLAAASARLDACADHHRLLIDIERLTGGGSVWLTTGSGVSP